MEARRLKGKLTEARLLVAIATFAFIVLFGQVCHPEGGRNASLLRQYLELDNATFQGKGFSQYDSWQKMHTSCVLCWAQTRVLESYLDIFLATNDQKWLRKFALQASTVLEATDASQGRKDYQGRSGPVWSTIHYTKGVPHVWVVHTGSICYPLLRFAFITRRMKLRRFDQASTRFLEAAKKAVAFHHGQYKSEGNLAGYWERPNAPSGLAGRFLPWNQQAAMGRTLLLLGRLTGALSYRARAQAMGRSLARHIITAKDGKTCYWPYQSARDSMPGRVDDVSHASLVAWFMLDLHRQGLVFSKNDLMRVANTFLIKVLPGGDQMARLIDGTGATNLGLPVFLWLPLSVVQPTIYQQVKKISLSRPDLLEPAFSHRPDDRGLAMQAAAWLLLLAPREEPRSLP